MKTHEEILDAEYNDDENDDACLKEEFFEAMHSKEAPDVETDNIKEETREDFFDVPLDSLNEDSVVNIDEQSFDIYTSTQKESIDAQEKVFKKHSHNDKHVKPDASLDSFVVKHKFTDDEKS